MVLCNFSHVKHGAKCGADIFEGQTWCGVQSSDYDFNDVNEAVADAYKVGRSYLCPHCFKKIVEALNSGRLAYYKKQFGE